MQPLTWDESAYRLSHCSDCDCRHDEPPRDGCDCACHGDDDD